jgi:hypothetical protein
MTLFAGLHERDGSRSHTRPGAAELIVLPGLSYFAADHVFLLVQHALFGASDVAAILGGHVTLFLPDLTVLAVKLSGLTATDLAIPTFRVDPMVLIRETVVHLCPPRMGLVEPSRVMADLAVHAVFLAVQHPLVGASDVATVSRSHVALFLANLMIFAVKLSGLAAAELAIRAVAVDCRVLVGEPLVDFRAARVSCVPFRGGEGATRRGDKKRCGEGKSGELRHACDNHLIAPIGLRRTLDEVLLFELRRCRRAHPLAVA